MDKDMFGEYHDEPAHKRYGYGAMWIGEIIELDLDEIGVSAYKLRNRLAAYAKYYNKKFQTKTVGSSMFIKRVY